MSHDDFVTVFKEPVEAVQGAPSEVEMRMKRGLTIKGRLASANLEQDGFNFLMLTGKDEDGVNVTKSHYLSEDGTFEFAGLKKGTYKISRPSR